MERYSNNIIEGIVTVKKKMQLDVGVSPPANIIKIYYHLIPNLYLVLKHQIVQEI